MTKVTWNVNVTSKSDFISDTLLFLVRIFIENELDKDIANENTIFPEHEILIEPELIDADGDFNEEIDQESKYFLKLM